MKNRNYSSNNKGNILLVANYESDVGYAWWLMENFWIHIANYFSKNGRKIFLIYPEITKIPDTINNAPLQVIQHSYDDRSKDSIKNFEKIIKDNNINSIYLTDKKNYDFIYLRLRLWGIKTIVLHDHAPGERSSVPFYKKIIKKIIFTTKLISCDYYIGVSKFVYDRFLNFGCIPAKRCSYILNGINPIEINEKNNNYVHDNFNIPKDSIVVITTGRATFYKGIDFLIECAHILINSYDEKKLYFIHCGDGPDLEKFKKMVTEYNIQKRFIFAGRRSDVPQLLQSCDIGIQTSIGEAFSLSILEYMSAGLATIVPNNCGNGEAIIHDYNGLLYESRNGDSAILNLQKLIHSAKYRDGLADNAKKTVIDRFTIERTNKELINFLKDKI